ncbi:hypothetical protein KGA66_27050 [Actinocrinis puniceicyclus]|uniref:Uncharacterized protein n=1 Tax=Actinocrinis puniceicyclus TaxID=977794 RepID=A0A8J7WX66_9ACTN|nr:hypothetical protein [Actinocrinis puniceicyclus]MBS2966724.1 hypothetical protein [Actinocrinis puniceicyclus]
MNLPLDPTRLILAMAPAAPRIKDKQTGEIDTNRDGVALYEVQAVMQMDGGAPLPMNISVPETGLADTIDIGSKLKATGLIARTGVSKFGKEYVMFSAAALTVAG